MSKLKRYYFDTEGMCAARGGEYVKFVEHRAALEQERERSRRLLEAAKIGLSWLQSDHTGRSGDLTGGDIGKIESAIKAYEGLDKTGEQEVG